jgi:hypothetical protein
MKLQIRIPLVSTMNEFKMKKLFISLTIICLFTISCGTGKKLDRQISKTPY